jgi:hypothetical protein
MEVGSILVGIAVFAVVVAYLARPFRRAYSASSLDWAVEAWVLEAREGGDWEAEFASDERGAQAADANGDVSFCTKCGRRAEHDDIFCAKCGTRLREA